MKWLLVLILPLMMLACKPKQQVIHHNTKEVITERWRDTSINVPSASVTQGVDSAFLTRLKNQLGQGDKDTVVVHDHTNSAELRFYLDQFGDLQAECLAKDRTIKALVKDVQSQRDQVHTEVTEVEKVIKETPTWNAMLIGGLIIISLLLILDKVIRK